MPELPDVEVFKRYADATSLHQNIAHVRILVPGLLKGTTAQALGRHLKAKSFTETHRHGKFLFLRADHDGWLLMHFGMTGRLEYGHWRDGPPEYSGCLVEFDTEAALAYVAPRKLGRIGWTEDVDTFIQAQGLGPDALSFDLAELRQAAERRRGSVKAWLMDQSAMAGVGNVYSDEILFRARIHPESQVANLDQDSLARLHRALTQVLNQAIKAQADPQRMPRSFLLPRRQAGAPCPSCQGKLERIRAVGRSAYFCPSCQTRH